jgi:NADH-quinone oxidoreductase subunit G
VLGDPLDPADTPAIDDAARAKLAGGLIYVGPFLDATAQQSAVLLPAASWSEEDGSLVNFEGRVQRVHRCHRPRGEGRPGWRVAADVAAQAGTPLPAWTSAADVLAALAASVEPFADVTQERLGLLGLPGRAASGARGR